MPIKTSILIIENTRLVFPIVWKKMMSPDIYQLIIASPVKHINQQIYRLL